MEKIRFSAFIVGYNDKDEKRQILTDEQCMEIITNCVSTCYDGATFESVKGLYKGEFEKSLKVSILWSDEKTDKKLIEMLKTTMNQESIFYQVDYISACYA